MNFRSECHVFENGVRVVRSHLTEDQLSRYLFRNVHEPLEEEIFCEAIHALRPRAAFVNIGAAIGYYPILAKKLAPHLRVLAVEPLPAFRDATRANMLLNGFTESDISIHGIVMGGTCGTTEFLDMDFGSAGLRSQLVSRGKRIRSRLLEPVRNLLRMCRIRLRQRLFHVEMLTLDHFLAGFNEPVGLCQMDVQGMEMDVLKGASASIASRRIDTFLIGTHSRDLHAACKSILQVAGYNILRDEPTPRDQPDGILHAALGNRQS